MFESASINEIAESWRMYVWHAGWQGTLVAGVILAVTLIKVAAHMPKRSHLVASLGFAETYHPLTQRIKRIIDVARPRPVRLSLLGAGLVVLASVTLLPGLDSGQNMAQAYSDTSRITKAEDVPNETPKSEVESAGLHGQVLLGTDKSPAAGADVHILKRGQAWRLANQENSETNEQGQFVFKRVEPGEYRIWATHNDWVSRQKRFKAKTVNVAKDGSVVEPIVLHLREGCVLRVRAISTITNQPLIQAQVHLTWSDIGNDFTADEHGIVTVRSLTQESWQYEVIAPGHGRIIRTAKLQRGKKNIFDVRLPAGGTLSGVVTDENNQGMEGVGVNLYPAGNGRPWTYVKTDEHGVYHLPHVPINTAVDLLFTRKSLVSASERKILLTEPNQIYTVNVQLKKPPLGGSVTGLVTNQQNQPIQEARAIFHTGSTGDIRKSKTDESGRFRMDDIPGRPGRMLLTIRAKGYEPENVTIMPGSQQTPQDLSIRLLPGHTIAGKVVDEAGQPISGVWVFAGGNRFPNRMGGNTHTDKEGRFSFDSLPSTLPFDFQAPGYSSIQRKNLTGDRDDYVIVMEEQGIIKGKLVDADSGAPIEHFNIRIRHSGDDYRGNIPSSFGNKGVDFNSKEGLFHIDELDSGTRLMFFVKVPGYAVQVHDPVVVQGASRSEPITLKYQAKPGLLAGQVVGPNRNARVFAAGLQNLKKFAATFWGIPAGRAAQAFTVT